MRHATFPMLPYTCQELAIHRRPRSNPLSHESGSSVIHLTGKFCHHCMVPAFQLAGDGRYRSLGFRFSAQAPQTLYVDAGDSTEPSEQRCNRTKMKNGYRGIHLPIDWLRRLLSAMVHRLVDNHDILLFTRSVVAGASPRRRSWRNK